MLLVIELCLCLPAILIILKLKEINLSKKERKIYNAILIGLAIIYIILCLTLQIEPFNFDDISRGSDYLLAFVVVFIFSPFLWITTGYYLNKLFKCLRVSKNKKLKSKTEYNYYRDDLDKISPNIIMFTSMMDIDFKKSIAASLLKLKLTGYLIDNNSTLKCTNKKEDNLTESEKMILESIKTQTLDEKKYKKVIEEEAIKNKYIKKNKNHKFIKILKIIITACIPVLLITFSTRFDKYVYQNYKTYLYKGVRYVSVENGEIGDIHYGNVENIDDYYHGVIVENGKKITFYDKALIKASKMENSIVRKTILLQELDGVILFASIILSFVVLISIIEQIIYFNKNYIRTMKGTELLTKAYALKNFLEDFSIIKERNEEEIVLWEYYLIYAVVLGVNVKITDKLIEKYVTILKP